MKLRMGIALRSRHPSASVVQLPEPTLVLAQKLTTGPHRYPIAATYIGNNEWGVRSVINPTDALVTLPVQTLVAAANDTQVMVTPPRYWYIAACVCEDVNAAVSGNSAGNLATFTKNSLTIPAACIRPGAQLQCTVTLTAPRPY